MSKNILVEELRRIHEMMGVKPKSILVEAILPKSRSFDVNLNPAIKSEIESSIVDWANNTVGLTKNGGRTTISDLIELGKKYAREAGDDATDSNALYYLAAKSGRNNFIDIVNRISSKIQKQAQQEFTNKLSSLTDTYTKDQLQGLLARNSTDLSGLDTAQIQALSNNLKSLKDSIDNSTIDSSLKTDLKKMVDDQIDTYETAAASIYVSRTKSLPSDIGDASSSAAAREVEQSSIDDIISKMAKDELDSLSSQQIKNEIGAFEPYEKLSKNQKAAVMSGLDLGIKQGKTFKQLKLEAYQLISEYAGSQTTKSGKSFKSILEGTLDHVLKYKGTYAVVVIALLLGGYGVKESFKSVLETGEEVGEGYDEWENETEEEEKRREEGNTGKYENTESDFNRWLDSKGWTGEWDSSLPEVTDNSGEPQIYEFKDGEWVII
jgi:hypothetical protein